VGRPSRRGAGSTDEVLVIIVEWGASRTVLVREAPETVITPETTAADPAHLRRASAALGDNGQ
jgi:hypothetical protein